MGGGSCAEWLPGLGHLELYSAYSRCFDHLNVSGGSIDPDLIAIGEYHCSPVFHNFGVQILTGVAEQEKRYYGNPATINVSLFKFRFFQLISLSVRGVLMTYKFL